MIKYLAKRLLLFLPTLFVISFIAFWLGKTAPGDPVEAWAPEDSFEVTDEDYVAIYQDLGLDKPMFYFGFSAAAFPDTLNRIPGRYHRESLCKLIEQYGNWPIVQAYNAKVESFSKKISHLPETINRDKIIKIRRIASQLLEAYEDPRIISYLDQVKKTVLNSNDSLIQAHIGVQASEMIESYAFLKNNQNKTNLYIPSLRWHGFDNQYHHWLSNFCKGDFGMSYRNGQPVLERIKTPIRWTLIINLIVIFLVYLFSVPLGVFSAIRKDTWMDKVISTILFLLYSLPAFWIGTMLLIFFTNSEYGMNWFAGAGLGSLPSDAPFWNRFWETASHLVLPVFCMTYGSLAFLSRQMRGSMLEVLNQDYIRTAKAKGLSNRSVIWKHGFRNALFPLVTIIAVVFPAAIAGSIVIETIFNIPGMGREVVDAIFSKDWPVLYTILMLVAILTMIGNLVADILYVVVDPRVKFK